MYSTGAACTFRLKNLSPKVHSVLRIIPLKWIFCRQSLKLSRAKPGLDRTVVLSQKTSSKTRFPKSIPLHICQLMRRAKNKLTNL